MIPTNFHLIRSECLKRPPVKRRRCHFLDDEAEASESDSDEEENEEGDLDGFIDNGELNEGVSFYHTIDQMRHHEDIDNIDIDTDIDIEIQRGGAVYPLKVAKKEMT